MRRVVVVAWMLAVLAAAPAAHADVTIGSALDATVIGGFVCPAGCTYSQLSITGRQTTPTTPGILTRWRVQIGTDTAPLRLQVVRRQAGSPSPGFVVGESKVVTPPANQTSEFLDRIPIQPGDQLGFCCATEPISVRRFATGSIDIWLMPLDMTARLPIGAPQTEELLLSADIEPDRDGDLFGDETQDNCGGINNPGQEDADGDQIGDACDADADIDGDGVVNGVDVCPFLAGVPPDGCPAPPATPRVNTPPVVRFRTPVSGTAVRAQQTIELDVFDDAGNPTVTLFDDDGEICSLPGPPYNCTWRPTGADVGRATLLASAVDSDNRSTLGIVRVRVAKFEADLTRRVRGRRVTGRLVLPAAVEKALGCRGEVTVRRGRRTQTVALKRNCTYGARVGGRGRVRARFAGNPVVEPAT